MTLLNIQQETIVKSRILHLISMGSKYPTVFTPNYGEFGPTAHKLMRMVYFFKAPSITVCCRKGEESYFPTANNFFYEWQDCIEDIHKWGFFTKKKLGDSINPLYQTYRANVKGDLRNIQKHFPKKTNFIYLWKYQIDKVFNQNSHLLSFDLQEKTSYNIYADVIISPRNRISRQENNFYQWEQIIRELSGLGISVGCVGSKDQSLCLRDSKVNSWDYEDNSSATIELLRKCKLYVGLDTGVSHLASLMSVPMIVFSHSNQKQYMTYLMKCCNRGFFKDLGKSIKNVDEITRGIVSYFDRFYHGKT